MVVIKRLWQPEKILEQTMQAGGMEQVLTAHHMGDALMRIVDHDRKVIAGGNILARQDDVAPRRRIGQNHAGLPARTCARFTPGQRLPAWRRKRHRGSHIEAQCERIAGIEPSATLGRRHLLCVSRIECNAVGIARPRPGAIALRHQARNLGAASPLALPPGPNAPLRDGGLFAPPYLE